MKAHSCESANVPALQFNLSGIPPLLDAEGIRRHLAPIGRTLLYELASRGEIQSASLGIGRGKRVFVTETVARWLQNRIAVTKRPKVVGRRPCSEHLGDVSVRRDSSADEVLSHKQPKGAK